MPGKKAYDLRRPDLLDVPIVSFMSQNAMNAYLPVLRFGAH
jgi:hypothetical protein